MADPRKIYWDACVWISLINEEPEWVERCRHLIKRAMSGEVQIWTSSLTLAEVFKKKCGVDAKGIPIEKDVALEDYIQQEFIFEVQVDHDIGVRARRLLRAHAVLKKPNDGIHLASAVSNNLDEFHTTDRENLLPLNGLILRQDGATLLICVPPETPPPPPPPEQKPESKPEQQELIPSNQESS